MTGPSAPLWNDLRLKVERIERLQGEMRRLVMGGLYLSDSENMRYVLNTKLPGGKLFVPAEGDPVAFVRGRDQGYVGLVHSTTEPTLYTNTWEPANDAKMGRFGQRIGELMAQHGAGGEPLGVDHLEAPAFHALLGTGLPIVDARPALEFAKSVKTQDEIAIYRWIGEQYVQAFSAFRKAMRAGATERELSSVVGSAWYDAGGEEVLQINVCAGEHMNPWRRWPTQRELAEGEFVGIDFHGRSVNGLTGDVSRTYWVGGTPTPDHRDLYCRAYEYLEATTAAFRAGRAIRDVMDGIPSVPGQYEAQLYNYDIAHPLGLTPSGYPMVKKGKEPDDDTLQPNQVFAIECYFGERGSPLAVKLEHLIVIRDGHPEVLDAGVPFDPVLSP